MPPALPDSLVGRASGPVGAARRIRKPVPSHSLDGHSGGPIRSTSSSALEALLVDLGSQIHLGTSQEVAETLRFCATGVPALDARLGGGFPCGRLCEICGVRSSGRTSLALATLAETLRRGVLAAWIDLADAFDPASAAAAGNDLERLLWVRARSEYEALRSCERLLQTEGFELVILDLAALPRAQQKQHNQQNRKRPELESHSRPHSESHSKGERGPIRDVSWLRLARLAASTRTTLLALSNTSSTGSRAEVVLEMQPLGVRFVGAPSLLDALETTAVVQRHRSGMIGQKVPLSIHAETS